MGSRLIRPGSKAVLSFSHLCLSVDLNSSLICVYLRLFAEKIVFIDTGNFGWLLSIRLPV